VINDDDDNTKQYKLSHGFSAIVFSIFVTNVDTVTTETFVFDD